MPLDKSGTLSGQPSLHGADAAMVSDVKNAQIFYPVIVAIAIYMIHMLSGAKLAANVRLHDMSMLKASNSVDCDPDVVFWLKVRDLLRDRITSLRTIFRYFSPAGRYRKLSPARLTYGRLARVISSLFAANTCESEWLPSFFGCYPVASSIAVFCRLRSVGLNHKFLIANDTPQGGHVLAS